MEPRRGGPRPVSTAHKFLFDRDFRNPGGSSAKNLADLQAAEQRGFDQGLAEGRRQAQGEAQARLAGALQRLADAAGMLLGSLDAQHAAAEDEALAFALALGRRLAGEALNDRPLAAMAEAARAALQHLRGVPHLAVRVNETLVEEVEALIQRIAREQGYEGRIIVLGDPDIAPGDVHLDWADGGVVRSQARIEEAVAQVLSGGAA